MNHSKLLRISLIFCLHSILATQTLLADSTGRETASNAVNGKIEQTRSTELDTVASSRAKDGHLPAGDRLNSADTARLVARDVGSQQQVRPKAKTRKRHLRVATIEVPPFMMKRKLSDVDDRTQASGDSSNQEDTRPGANDTQADPVWHGYCMDFFLELIKQLSFEVTYDIYEVPDGKFGAKIREMVQVGTVANSTGGASGVGGQEVPPLPKLKKVEHWNGLIGELQRGRAELVLAPMAVMAERELEVDFTMPFYDLVGIQILLKRPEVPKNWFKFLTVLDNDVWLSIALAYFVTSFMIYIFDRLSPYSHKNLTRIERVRHRRMAAPSQRPANKLATTADWAKAIGPNQVAPAPRFYLSRPLKSVDGQSSGGAANHNPVGPLKRRRPSQGYLENLRISFGAPLGVVGVGVGGGGQHGALWGQNGSEGGGGADHSDSLNGDDGHGDGDDDDDDDDDGAAADGKPDFNLRDSLWFCITSLTPQGGGEAPQNLSGRVVAGAWWLFCFIVIASYTANLAAFLTVSRLDIPIESLDDLAKQYRIKYAPIDGTAERTYFERMAHIEEIFYNIWKNMSLSDNLSEVERSKFAVWDYPISDKYTKIWAQIQEVQMPASLQEGLERVRASTLDDGFALLANANLVKYAVMTDCSLKAVGDEFSRKPIALAVQKGQDELRDELSYAILRLINQRYMEVLREKWWTNNPARVVCESNDESEGISIENIGGVFIIIVTGIFLSFLVWAIERFVYTTKIDVSRELLPAVSRINDELNRVASNSPAKDSVAAVTYPKFQSGARNTRSFK